MASPGREVLEFHYDISCPFAYIASTRIGALASRTNADLKWSPVLLGVIYRETAAPQGAAGSASDVFNPTKQAISARAINRTLKRYNVPFKSPSNHPQRTPDALRLIYAVPNGKRPALTHALFKAYWVDDKDISDRSVLVEVSKSVIPNASMLLENMSSNGDAQDALRDTTSKVIARGGPGVPSFWIPEERWTDSKGNARHGRLYWGQDRMLFVEAVLHALNGGIHYEQVPGLGGLQPRCQRDNSQSLQQRQTKLEFWFDFSSPWAFLGWTQLERMKREAGPSLQIEMKPILVGALFKDIGAPMLPGAALSEQKQAYDSQDLFDWVRHWNALNAQENLVRKPIKFRYPDIFPIRSPTILRCAIVEPSLVPLLYSACWEQNVDVANEKILIEYFSKLGIDITSTLKKASAAPVEDILRADTAEAKEIGICGVPSYRVSEKIGADWVINGIGNAIVWGQDELGVVQDLIAGWKETESQTTADVSLAQRMQRDKAPVTLSVKGNLELRTVNKSLL